MCDFTQIDSLPERFCSIGRGGSPRDVREKKVSDKPTVICADASELVAYCSKLVQYWG